MRKLTYILGVNVNAPHVVILPVSATFAIKRFAFKMILYTLMVLAISREQNAVILNRMHSQKSCCHHFNPYQHQHQKKASESLIQVNVLPGQVS